MKILVTGGAGFIGSQLSKKLVWEYPNVKLILLDNLSHGSWKNLGEEVENKRIVKVYGDVSEYNIVDSLIRDYKVDIILSMATHGIVPSIDAIDLNISTNFIGNANVLKASQKYGVEKIIYTSTTAIYGNQKKFPTYEDSPINLLSPYAVTKKSTEHLCEMYKELYGLDISIIRYSNVYGPGQHPKNPYCGVISIFIEKALKNEPLLIFGDGEQTRDFTYIEDALNATLLVLTKNNQEVFNIGTETETSIIKLAETIIKLTNSTSEIKFVNKRVVDTITRRNISYNKIKQFSGFTPTFKIETGLQKTIEYINEEYHI